MNVIEHLLTVLSEECNETAHRISKALRFGLHEKQRNNSADNAHRISQELNDLYAMAVWMVDEGIIPEFRHAAAAEAKVTKVKEYMAYSVSVGALQGHQGKWRILKKEGPGMWRHDEVTPMLYKRIKDAGDSIEVCIEMQSVNFGGGL